MPPRGVKSPKRKRQYEHIKASGRKRGMSEGRAEEMAARTVNKERRQAGETRSSGGTRKSRKTSGRSARQAGGSRKTTRSRKTASRRRS